MAEVTVGELRELITDLPDEMIVFYVDNDYGECPAHLAAVQTFKPYLGEETTGLVIN